jgi:hypothetical protein
MSNFVVCLDGCSINSDKKPSNQWSNKDKQGLKLTKEVGMICCQPPAYASH